MKLNNDKCYSPIAQTQGKLPAEQQDLDLNKLYELCLLYLNQEELNQLKTAMTKHFGPHSNYSSSEDLKRLLQLIINKIAANSSSDVSISVLKKIHERASYCTIGFHDDCQQIFIDLLCQPESLDDFLAKIRQDIMYSTAAQLSADVHVNNQVSIISSVWFGTQALNPHDPIQAYNQGHIYQALKDNFSQKYTPFKIMMELNSYFKHFIETYCKYGLDEDAAAAYSLINDFIKKIFFNHTLIKRLKKATEDYETFIEQQSVFKERLQALFSSEQLETLNGSFFNYLLEPREDAFLKPLKNKYEQLDIALKFAIHAIRVEWLIIKEKTNIRTLIEARDFAQEKFHEFFWLSDRKTLSFAAIREAFWVEMIVQGKINLPITCHPTSIIEIHRDFNSFPIRFILDYFGIPAAEEIDVLEYFEFSDNQILEFFSNSIVNDASPIDKMEEMIDYYLNHQRLIPGAFFQTSSIKKIFMNVYNIQLLKKIANQVDEHDLIPLFKDKCRTSRLIGYYSKVLPIHICSHFAKEILQKENFENFNTFYELSSSLNDEDMRRAIDIFFNQQPESVVKLYDKHWNKHIHFILNRVSDAAFGLIYQSRVRVKELLLSHPIMDRYEICMSMLRKLNPNLEIYHQDIFYFASYLSKTATFAFVKNFPNTHLSNEVIISLLSLIAEKDKLPFLRYCLPFLRQNFTNKTLALFFQRLKHAKIKQNDVDKFIHSYLRPYFSEFLLENIEDLWWFVANMEENECISLFSSDMHMISLYFQEKPWRLIDGYRYLDDNKVVSYTNLLSFYCPYICKDLAHQQILNADIIKRFPKALIHPDVLNSLKNIQIFTGFILSVRIDLRVHTTIHFLFEMGLIETYGKDSSFRQIIDCFSSEDYLVFFEALINKLQVHHKTILANILSHLSPEEINTINHLVEPFRRRSLDSLTRPSGIKRFFNELSLEFESLNELLAHMMLLETANIAPFIKTHFNSIKTHIHGPEDIVKFKQLIGTQSTLMLLLEMKHASHSLENHMQYFRQLPGMTIEFVFLSLYAIIDAKQGHPFEIQVCEQLMYLLDYFISLDSQQLMPARDIFHKLGACSDVAILLENCEVFNYLRFSLREVNQQFMP